MKNLVKVLSVLLVFGIVVASCQKDEALTKKSEAVSLEASFNAKADVATASKSGVQRASSDLNRGTIPACVSKINVLAHSVAGDINNLFNIIESTDDNTAIAMIQAYLGQNTFTATTPDPIFDSPVATDLAGKDVDQLRVYLKELRPYAVFTDVVNQMITEAEEPLAFNMTTLNGRMSMVFNPEAGLLDNYNLKVTISKSNGTPEEVTITAEDAVKYFYWSDETCVNGETLSLTVKFFAKSDVNYATVLKTLNCTSTDDLDLLVVGGEGHNMKVNISKDNVLVESVQSTFEFVEIVDEDVDVNL